MSSAQKQVLLDIRDVKKTYVLGEVQVPVLRGISLEVRKGEFLAVMGPSGSGKSTLMNMIGALDVPTSGKVILAGKDIASLSESDLALLRGKRIGFVFQKFFLVPSLSALENVQLPLIFLGFDAEERFDRAKAVLESIGLGPRMHHRPNQLSGGEQQRVAIARALAVEPDIVLADEPTGNLDSLKGKEVLKLLTQLHEQGKTLVVVTHDPAVAEHAQRIVHIKDGMIERQTKR